MNKESIIILESKNGIYKFWQEREYFYLKLVTIKTNGTVIPFIIKDPKKEITEMLEVGDSLRLKFKGYNIEKVLNEIKKSGFNDVESL